MANNIVYGIPESYICNNSSLNGVMQWSEYAASYTASSVLARRTYGSSDYVITIFKFSVPAFLGTPEYLKVSFKGAANGQGSPASLRFSLCVSMDNRAAYTTSLNPSDAYRLAQVDTYHYLPQREDGYNNPITVEIEGAEIKPETTYYLFIQNISTPTQDDYVTDVWITDFPDTTVEVGYNSGLVYINNEPYWCYIGNGGTTGTEADWDLYIPYIGNGGTTGTEADWNMCS